MYYLLYYIIFGFIGWIIEYVYISFHSKNNKISLCGDSFNKYIGICMPFLHIYSIGAVLLAYLANKLHKLNFIYFSIISGILITIMECIIGNISFVINKEKQWDYHSNICNGFISFDIFIYWIICSYIFRWIYHFIEKKYNIFIF
jgi:uncharacterized membrane protein